MSEFYRGKKDDALPLLMGEDLLVYGQPCASAVNQDAVPNSTVQVGSPIWQIYSLIIFNILALFVVAQF